MKFESSHLVLGLFLEAIALCLITSFRFINIESTVTLLIFNLLFLSLTFQLNGSLNRKLGMIKQFLAAHGFDFKLAESKVYCRSFFNHLGDEEKKVLLGFLSEFVQQPFIKIKMITPNLISKIFSSEGVYLYWVNNFSAV